MTCSCIRVKPNLSDSIGPKTLFTVLICLLPPSYIVSVSLIIRKSLNRVVDLLWAVGFREKRPPEMTVFLKAFSEFAVRVLW